jgi:hypothetical protein
MNFLTSHYHNSTGPAFVEAGDFTVLDPLNSSIDATNWNLVQERSYHVTLAINVATIQAIPGGVVYFRGLVERDAYVFFVSVHSWRSFMTPFFPGLEISLSSMTLTLWRSGEEDGYPGVQ